MLLTYTDHLIDNFVYVNDLKANWSKWTMISSVRSVFFFEIIVVVISLHENKSVLL